MAGEDWAYHSVSICCCQSSCTSWRLRSTNGSGRHSNVVSRKFLQIDTHLVSMSFTYEVVPAAHRGHFLRLFSIFYASASCCHVVWRLSCHYLGISLPVYFSPPTCMV